MIAGRNWSYAASRHARAGWQSIAF